MNVFKAAREMAKTANSWIWTALVFAIFDEVVFNGRITKKACDLLDGKNNKNKEEK